MNVLETIDLSILRVEPILKENYNKTYFWILPRDPRAACAIYEIGENTKKGLKKQFGEHFFDQNYLVMHVYQVDGQGEFNGFNYLPKS